MITAARRVTMVVLAVLAIYAAYLAGNEAMGAQRCETVASCRHAIDWQKKNRHHLRVQLRAAAAHGLSLDYIARIGAAISGRPPREFRSVGRCESTDVVTSQEYGFAGATGWLQYQWQTWKGTVIYRLFGGSPRHDTRLDPLLETVAAAVYLARGGHWSGPWLSSKHCHGLS